MTDDPRARPEMDAVAHVDDVAIADLLNGLLDAERTAAFLEHTQVCAECEARFRERAAEFEALRVQATP